MGAGYNTPLLAWVGFFFQLRSFLKIQQMYLYVSHPPYKGRSLGSPPHCLASGSTGGQALALTFSALVPAASGDVGRGLSRGGTACRRCM